jgi:DNA-binding GntR family transcriptional regulator
VRRDVAGATVISRRHHEPALLTTLNEHLKQAILEMVSATPQQRLRPHELKKALAHKLGASGHTVQESIKNLMEEGRLTFTCRNPTSYLEVPDPASQPGACC